MGREGMDLPDSVEALRALVLSKQALLDEQAAVIEERQARVDELSGVVEEKTDRIDALEELVRLLRHQRFGRKSEKASTHQLGLFNEAEASVHEVEGGDAEDDEIDVPAHKRRKGGRRPIPDSGAWGSEQSKCASSTSPGKGREPGTGSSWRRIFQVHRPPG